MDVNSGWRGGGGGRREGNLMEERNSSCFHLSSIRKKFHFQEVKTVSASSLISSVHLNPVVFNLGVKSEEYKFKNQTVVQGRSRTSGGHEPTSKISALLFNHISMELNFVCLFPSAMTLIKHRL